MDDYEERCRAATTYQGLDRAVQDLSKLFTRVTVDQTGGFCMAINVPAKIGHVWVTNDGSEEEPEYIVGWYPDDEEQALAEGSWSSEWIAGRFDVTHAALPEVVAWFCSRESTEGIE